MSGKIALSYKILSVLKALTEYSDQAVTYICNNLFNFVLNCLEWDAAGTI